MSYLDSFKTFIENPRSMSGNKYVRTDFFFFRKNSNRDLLFRNICFCFREFCYIKSEHFAMWRSRVLVFNEGPVGNFPRIS